METQPTITATKQIHQSRINISLDEQASLEDNDTNTSSPMKEYILQQQARINEIIGNATLFHDHYSELTQNIISSMNKQIKSYVKNSKKSIMKDIYSLVIDSIDWSSLQTKLTDMLKSNKSNLSTGNWNHIVKPEGSISQYDDDILTNMLLNCDVENVKNFQKCRKIAINQLNELVSDVDEFETQLCQYRTEVVKSCLDNNINVLFNYHFNYVNDLFHKRNPQSTVIIDGKEIKLVKSQKAFITSALKTLIQ